MINWEFLKFRNLLLIGAIVLLTRFTFFKVVNSLDGKAAKTQTQ